MTNFTTTFAYDIDPPVPAGLKCTDQTDANGIVTRSCYDSYNNLRDVRQDYAGKNIATYYTYENGLLTEIEDANEYHTQYYYDKMRRLIGIDYPDVDAGTYCATPHADKKCDVRHYYNPIGMLWKKIDAKGQETHYSYDKLGRLKSKNYITSPENGDDIIYYYNLPSGKNTQMLLKVEDKTKSPPEGRTITFTYNGLYQLDSIVEEEGTISYTYNADDSLHSYAVDSGEEVIYSYYKDGSVQQISKGEDVCYDLYCNHIQSV